MFNLIPYTLTLIIFYYFIFKFIGNLLQRHLAVYTRTSIIIEIGEQDGSCNSSSPPDSPHSARCRLLNKFAPSIHYT